MNQVSHLQSRFRGVRGLSFRRQGDLDLVQVENRHAQATIFLQGAQISHFAKTDERPLLWLSEACEFKASQPLRGGIPICAPWFGAWNRNEEAVRRQVSQPNPPAHGFLRERIWDLNAVQAAETETRLIFESVLATNQDPLWPFAMRFRYTICIGSSLGTDLEFENRGDRAVSLTAALHTYLAVGNAEEVTIRGLQNRTYIDAAADWRETTQRQRDLAIRNEVNRVYFGLDQTIEIIDRTWNRRIRLQAHGTETAVVWNPGPEKSPTLSQMGKNSWRQMLCVETARALRDFLTIDPGSFARFGVKIETLPLVA